MDESLNILVATALVIGFTHTLIGPDHYLPFIVLGRAEEWTLRKTLMWTFLCGLGHVGSSVVIGGLGIALGWSLSGMEGFEGIRGGVASYSLMGFGALYMLWGLYRALRGKGHGHKHVHTHVHDDGAVHAHSHAHISAYSHGHDHDAAAAESEDATKEATRRRTFWAIFVVFVLGPCEPLIPMLMVPASMQSVWGIVMVSGVFAVATIGVMLTVVTLGYYGLRLVRFPALEKYVHALSGGAIFLSGLAIQMLGI
jgi:nickel/cobalt transporter (NicO) family protein